MTHLRRCALVLVIALTAAACGGGSDGVETSTGGDGTATDVAGDDPAAAVDDEVDGIDTANDADDDENNSTDGAGDGGATTADSSDATPTSAAPAATPKPTAAPPSGTSTEATAPARGLKVGQFAYANTGRVKVSGCAAIDEPPPPTTKLTVKALAGDDQTFVLGEGDSAATTVLRHLDDGAHLVHLDASLGGEGLSGPAGAAGSVEFDPRPPPLIAPAKPTAGQVLTFSMKSTDGNYTVDTTITVGDLAASVTLGDGSTVTAVRARSVSHVTGTSPFGPVDLTIDSTLYSSPEHRLTVRTDSKTNGTAGVCVIDVKVDSVLGSTTPK